MAAIMEVMGRISAAGFEQKWRWLAELPHPGDAAPAQDNPPVYDPPAGHDRSITSGMRRSIGVSAVLHIAGLLSLFRPGSRIHEAPAGAPLRALILIRHRRYRRYHQHPPRRDQPEEPLKPPEQPPPPEQKQHRRRLSRRHHRRHNRNRRRRRLQKNRRRPRRQRRYRSQNRHRRKPVEKPGLIRISCQACSRTSRK